MKTAFAILALLALLAFAQSAPTITSAPIGLTDGQIKGSNFGSTKGVVYIQPRLVLNAAMRDAGVTEVQAAHILSMLYDSNRIELKGVGAWADGQIAIALTDAEKNDIQTLLVAKAKEKLDITVIPGNFAYSYQVQTSTGEASDWSK